MGAVVGLMRQHIGQATRRVLLVALSCAIALAAFTSALTIAEFHDHDCTGDGCHLCLVLDLAQATINTSATPAASLAVASAALVVSIFALAMWNLVLSAKTPVSERVLLLI